MPEVVIKYNNERTLNILKELAKYFDFIVSLPKSKKKSKEIMINGVSVISANPSVDTSAMTKIFTGKNIDAKELRTQAWQRKK